MSFSAGFLVLAVASFSGANMRFESGRAGQSYVEACSRSSLMQTFQDEKESRTPAQKKINSQLLYALKQKRGITKGVPTEPIKIELDREGRALVDINANVTTEVLAQIRKLGGAVISDDARYHTIRAGLALEKLEALAKRKDVMFIAPAALAMNNRGNNSIRPN
jgi:hypothetical protein